MTDVKSPSLFSINHVPCEAPTKLTLEAAMYLHCRDSFPCCSSAEEEQSASAEHIHFAWTTAHLERLATCL